MQRQHLAPPIPIDHFREALSRFRLNQATIHRSEPKRGGLR
jgi:hypothetical protein